MVKKIENSVGASETNLIVSITFFNGAKAFSQTKTIQLKMKYSMKFNLARFFLFFNKFLLSKK